MIRCYAIGAKAIAIVVAVAMIVLFLLWGPASCRSKQGLKKQAEVSAAQGQASIESGQEAMNTMGNLAAKEDATDAAVREGSSAIRAAPEGQKGKATRAAGCRLQAYRDRPECKDPAK